MDDFRTGRNPGPEAGRSVADRMGWMARHRGDGRATRTSPGLEDSATPPEARRGWWARVARVGRFSYTLAMSILLDENSRVIVQGITGREGQARTRLMLDYGTNVVAGVTPGKGGTTVLGVPVFDTCAEAVAALGARATGASGMSNRGRDARAPALEGGL